jgi:hypothetical protein
MSRKLQLKDPYFSAWKKFGWAKGTWGLGISVRFLQSAGLEGDDITVVYETTTQVHQWNAKISDLREFTKKQYPEYVAGQTPLIVFPVTIFSETISLKSGNSTP